MIPSYAIIKKSEIEREYMVCPYCADPQGNKLSCCGEDHFTLAYIVNGDFVFSFEVEVMQ